jgi:hypothetical protein
MQTPGQVKKWDNWQMENWKRRAKMPVRPNLRYYPDVCLKGMKKDHKKPASGLRFES